MFINSKREKIGELVKNKDVRAYLVDIPVILNNSGLSFKNNIEYIRENSYKSVK